MTTTMPWHSDGLPRLRPKLPLPPYAFVPRGPWPHPVRDPKGHSHHHQWVDTPSLEAARWFVNETYLFGFDLFNHGFYWEAHEAWEFLWRRALGSDRVTATFLKALIKLSAAGVKVREGVAPAVLSHANRAAELFCETATLAGAGAYFGCTLVELAEIARAVAARPAMPSDTVIQPVHRVFDFILLPKIPREVEHA